MSFLYPKNVSFECSKCALCCKDTEKKARRILLLNIEAERISEIAVMGVYEFAEKIKGFEPYTFMMKKNVRGECLFLKDKSCSIYKIRPMVCRFYPFQLISLRRNRHVFTCTDECPGLGNGACLKRSFFQGMVEDLRQLMNADQERENSYHRS